MLLQRVVLAADRLTWSVLEFLGVVIHSAEVCSHLFQRCHLTDSTLILVYTQPRSPVSSRQEGRRGTTNPPPKFWAVGKTIFLSKNCHLQNAKFGTKNPNLKKNLRQN